MKKLVFACFLGILPTLAHAESQKGYVLFDVLMSGKPFGTHRIDVDYDSGTKEYNVNVAIHLKYKFGPVTMFRYDHQNHEVWRNGVLQSIATTTDDDGNTWGLKSAQDGTALVITRTSSSSGTAALTTNDVIPTSYWFEGMTRYTAWLDTQKGVMRNVAITSVPPTNGCARAYRVAGELQLENVGYFANGDLCTLAFTARKRQVTYKMVSYQPFPAAF